MTRTNWVGLLIATGVAGQRGTYLVIWLEDGGGCVAAGAHNVLR